MADPRERRALVPTRANQTANLDYVISVEFALPLPGGEARLFVRYVPDRALLDTDSLGPYLTAASASHPGVMEQTAVTVLEDLNSELVPRWVQVLVRRDGSGGSGGSRSHGAEEILVENRQPNWDNAPLLAGLRPL